MNETLRALLLAWLALLGSAALAAPAAAPGRPQRLTSLDQVPAGLAKSDWQSIRAAYETGRHEFQPSPLTTDPIAQQAYLKASNTGAEDRFGWSVSVSGDTVVVGAPYEDSNATGVNGNQANNSASDAGAAYIFTGVGPGKPPVVGRTLRLAPGTGGERRFISTGIPGGAHRLQAAATIAGRWTDVPGAGTAETAAANGELLLEDATPPNDTIFYRAIGP